MRHYILTIVALIALNPSIPSTLHAQRAPTLLLDRDASMAAGVNNLATVEQLFFSAQDRILPPRLSSERSIFSKTLGITYRLARFAVADQAEVTYSLVVLHEVFGHGARAREFGWPAQYSLPLPPPYGKGGGSTEMAIPSNAAFAPLAAMSVGGMESDNLTARRLANQSARHGSMTYWESHRYLWAFIDQFFYVNSDDSGEGNDVSSYLYATNRIRIVAGQKQLSRNDLQRQSFWSLADPNLALALYGVIGAHLVGGRDTIGLPMIGLGKDFRYLPYARYSLSPAGPEYHLEQLLRRGNQLYTLDLRTSTDGFNNGWGATAGMTGVVQRPGLGVDGRAGVWRQQELQLGVGSLPPRRMHLGGMAEATVRWHPTLGSPLNVVGQLGYKTAGFVEGERVSRGFTVRIGVGLRGGGRE